MLHDVVIDITTGADWYLLNKLKNQAFAGINVDFSRIRIYTTLSKLLNSRYPANFGMFDTKARKYMSISYKRLWKLLIDRDMKKKDLQRLAGVSAASITKLGKNKNVNTDILEKICIASRQIMGRVNGKRLAFRFLLLPKRFTFKFSLINA